LILVYFGDNVPAGAQFWLNQFFNGFSDKEKPLSDVMMRTWTNFAKSG